MEAKIDLKIDDILINKKLDVIIKLLLKIIRKEENIMATLDEVLAAVTEERTVVDGVSALLDQLKLMLDEALARELTPAQQAKVDAIFAAAQGNKTELATALLDHTPQAPPVP